MRARWQQAGSLPYIEVAVEAVGKDTGAPPLVIALHGRGSSPDDLAGIAPLLDPGWRYVLPQAPRRLDFGAFGTGHSWYEPIPAQPAVMAVAREALTSFLAEIHARYDTPPERTALLGFSQGAVMTLDTGLRAPQRYAALVAMSGYLAEADDLAPVLARARQQPILLVHGTRDDVLSVALARRARRVLEDAGLTPEYQEFDLAHEVSPASLQVVRDFLHRHLDPPATSNA